jgi:hypothetical protein
MEIVHFFNTLIFRKIIIKKRVLNQNKYIFAA